MFFHLTRISQNSKTGPMPVSTTSKDSCPDACPFKTTNMCYAKHGPMRMHWDAVSNGLKGTDWTGFLEAIRKLPRKTLWRHNQAGDLPGIGDTLDCDALGELVQANQGRRGYTYSHKPLTTDAEREAVHHANQNGFTVNLSGNDLIDADRLADLGIAPVVCVLPSTFEGKTTQTPKGRPVRVCPASYDDDVNCATCGVCAVVDRKSIIGFIAHGTGKHKYDRHLVLKQAV